MEDGVAILLLLSYTYIMKNYRKPPGKLRKVRSKTNTDIYYTFENWDTQEIEGITFVPVVKDVPDNIKLQQIFYMRKDNLESVK